MLRGLGQNPALGTIYLTLLCVVDNRDMSSITQPIEATQF